MYTNNRKMQHTYNEFMQLVASRHSVRAYSPETLTEEEINAVLEAARLAPSACNRQPWKFYVVTNEPMRHAMLAKSRPGFLDAPVLIVAVGLHAEAWHRPADGKDHTDVDVSIAVEHMCLAAEAAGLDTCWICSFDTEAVRNALNLAADQEPIALLPLGRKAESDAPAKIRKDMAQIVEYVR